MIIKRDRISTISMILGCVIGVIVACTFFSHASTLYSKTPSDPQKAIGYFFIALYSGVIGATTFGSVYFGSVVPSARGNGIKMCGVILLALSLAIATVMLIMFSPK